MPRVAERVDDGVGRRVALVGTDGDPHAASISTSSGVRGSGPRRRRSPSDERDRRRRPRDASANTSPVFAYSDCAGRVRTSASERVGREQVRRVRDRPVRRDDRADPGQRRLHEPLPRLERAHARVREVLLRRVGPLERRVVRRQDEQLGPLPDEVEHVAREHRLEADRWAIAASPGAWPPDVEDVGAASGDLIGRDLVLQRPDEPPEETDRHVLPERDRVALLRTSRTTRPIASIVPDDVAEGVALVGERLSDEERRVAPRARGPARRARPSTAPSPTDSSGQTTRSTSRAGEQRARRVDVVAQDRVALSGDDRTRDAALDDGDAAAARPGRRPSVRTDVGGDEREERHRDDRDGRPRHLAADDHPRDRPPRRTRTGTTTRTPRRRRRATARPAHRALRRADGTPRVAAVRPPFAQELGPRPGAGDEQRREPAASGARAPATSMPSETYSARKSVSAVHAIHPNRKIHARCDAEVHERRRQAEEPAAPVSVPPARTAANSGTSATHARGPSPAGSPAANSRSADSAAAKRPEIRPASASDESRGAPVSRAARPEPAACA